MTAESILVPDGRVDGLSIDVWDAWPEKLRCEPQHIADMIEQLVRQWPGNLLFFPWENVYLAGEI